MSLKTIGQNIRAHRQSQHMRIEELAFKAELSKNYLSLVERGQKTPSLETLISIANALHVSADQILCDVVDAGFKVRSTVLSERIEKVSPARRKLIYNVLDALLQEDEE